MNPLLARFIPEAQELIQQSATGILKLEKDPENEVAINEIFRAVHTLKGASGLFDALPLTNLVHAGEDVLSAVRSGALKLTADIADHILDMLDQVGVWLGDMEKEESLPPSSAEISHRLASALRVFLPQLADDASHAAKDRAEPEDDSWVDALLKQPDFRACATSAAQSSQTLTVVEYRPSDSCFYSGEDPVNQMTQVPELGAFSVSLRSPWPSIEDLDPYRCNLIFRAMTLAPRDEIVHLFRYVMDQVSIASLSPACIETKLAGDARPLRKARPRQTMALRTRFCRWRCGSPRSN